MSKKILLFFKFLYFHKKLKTLSSAPMADNVSHTRGVSASVESLLRVVGDAVSGSHIVSLVPNVSHALGGGDVGCMVIPSPDFEFRSVVGGKEHGLGSKVLLGVGPLNGGALQLAMFEVSSAGGSGDISVQMSVALQSSGSGPVT